MVILLNRKRNERRRVKVFLFGNDNEKPNKMCAIHVTIMKFLCYKIVKTIKIKTLK
jgi:3'-phosphoadenosine 5'-phosphosulfate sulfotransferase